MNLKEKAQKLKKKLTVIFLALKSNETPWYVKIVAGITVGYALSPIDLIPDFIPILGYLDDIIILPLLIILTLKLIPKPIMEQVTKDVENMWEKEKPKRWCYAIPIIAIRTILIFYILNKLLIK